MKIPCPKCGGEADSDWHPRQRGAGHFLVYKHGDACRSGGIIPKLKVMEMGLTPPSPNDPSPPTPAPEPTLEPKKNRDWFTDDGWSIFND